MEKVSAVTLHYILQVLQSRYRIDTDSLLEHARIDANIFESENGYVDSDKLKLLFKEAAKQCNDPYLPLHLGEASSPQSIGLLGYMLTNTATVGEMLEKLCHFSALIGKNLKFHLPQTKSGYKLTLHMHDNPMIVLQRYQSEIHLSAVISLIRQLSGHDILPEAAYFQHEEVEILDEYHRLFGPHLHFEAYENALVFSKEKLDIELKTPNVGMLKYFESQAKQIIEELYEESCQSRTKRQILVKLGNEDISIESVARAMGISARTLQSRLKNEGITYGELLQNVRMKLAKHYLHNFAIDIGTISIYLGYNDISIFTRSFKKWFDMTPSAYRKEIPYSSGHAAIESDKTLNVVYTPATEDDVEALVALVNSVYRGEHSKQGWTTEANILEGKRVDTAWVRDVIESSHSTLIVARRHGAVIGCLQIDIEAPVAHLGLFAVDVVSQTLGIGKRLLQEAEVYAKSNNISTLQLEIIDKRADIILYYERRGFQATGESLDFPVRDDLWRSKVGPLQLLVYRKQL